MEDKRTLLAFLLIGLILLLIPYYYEWMGLAPKPEAPREKVVQNASEERPPGAPSAPMMEPVQPEKSIPFAADPSLFIPRSVSVHTPLQKLSFSTEGGILSSCQLLRYHKVSGEPVELVPYGGQGLVLTLNRFEASQDLSRQEFVPDHQSLRIGPGEQGTLRMVADLGGGKQLQKVLTFYGDRYGFQVDLLYQGFDEDSEAVLSWKGGIASTEQHPEIDRPETRALAYFNEERVELNVEDGEEETWTDKGALRWAGVRNKYFLAAFVPGDGEKRFSTLLQGTGKGQQILPDYTFAVGHRIGPSGSWKSIAYLGPLDYDNLIRYQSELEQAIDFGWPVVRQVSQFLLIFFKATYGYVPNYGWIIVLFAVAIKILVYPLTHKTYESAAKMQELQPKVAALQKKYKDDRQKLQQELMELYRKHKVNPLGGCLPMILQVPVFIALFNIFYTTIELRHAPFVLWIKDLSDKDPYYILPIIMGVSMVVQQKLQPTTMDPRQARILLFLPVVFTYFFLWFPSGLVLYWLVNNILSILQMYITIRYLTPAKA